MAQTWQEPVAGPSHAGLGLDSSQHGTGNVLSQGQEQQQAAASSEAPSKRGNPLTDLIATEQEYVEALAKIIRKVASAWSKANFPPKQLDRLFRAIEACFRCNKALLAQLVDIGPTPASPKALGDLLMRWVDDLEPSYAAYSTAYRCGFDDFAPVKSNPKLPNILAALPPELQSLDALFRLPYARLKYYKRLYTKLLKSTVAGRSDHRQLSAANDKLDGLLARCDSVLHLPVEGTPASSSPLLPPGSPALDKPVPDRPPPPLDKAQPAVPDVALEDATPTLTQSQMQDLVLRSPRAPSPLSIQPPPPAASSARNSQASSNSQFDSRTSSWSQSGGPDTSRASTATQDYSPAKASSLFERPGQFNSVSSQATSVSKRSSIDWLEARLDTQRALDVFSMKPKKCRLQINPPGLTFSRSIRHDGDVSMSFQLSPGSVEAVQRSSLSSSSSREPYPAQTHLYVPAAHIFLLTDLFLICERIPLAERDRSSRTEADMWLLFPPLAGKHLAVQPGADPEGRTFDIVIMRREVLRLTCPSRQERDLWLGHFEDCIAFGGSAAQPVPLTVRTDLSALDRKSSSMSSITATTAYPHSGMEFTPPNPGIAPMPVASPHSLDARFSSSMSMRSSRSELAPPHEPPLSPPRSMSASASIPAPSGFHDSLRSRSTSPLPGSGYQPFAQGAYHPPAPHQGSPRRPSMPTGQLPPGAQRSFSPPPGSVHPMARSQGPSYTNGAQQGLRKNSSRSTGSLREYGHQFGPQSAPPMPSNASHMSLDALNGYLPRHQSFGNGPQYRSPSLVLDTRAASLRSSQSHPMAAPSDSPPATPVQPTQVTNQLIAQMKCKVFLQTSHQQWKALGTTKLMLYLQSPGNGKQLVCQQENKDKTTVISTMVLTDGVERMGKTGVAIELSDQGARTGIIYMLQLKTEQSATGLFNQLLQGSDRRSAAA